MAEAKASARHSDFARPIAKKMQHKQRAQMHPHYCFTISSPLRLSRHLKQNALAYNLSPQDDHLSEL